MPQAPYAAVRASIAGGANQTGGITATGGQTCQLSADPAGLVGATQYRWEILDYPTNFALPAGWVSDGQTPPVYYYSGQTPPVFTLDANVARWGKYTLQLTLNGGGPGLTGRETTAQLEAIRLLTDASCALKVLSPNGLHGSAFGESTQFGGRLGWIGDWKKTLYVIELLLGGGGGVLAHSALTGLTADDHPQYLLTDGTRALTGNISAGSHKITSLADGNVATDAVNKGQLDAAIAGATGGHAIKSQGGASLTQRATLNFAAPFQASDNGGATRTDVDLLLDGGSLSKSASGLKVAAAGVVAAMLAAGAVDLTTSVITGQLPIASMADLAGLSVLGRSSSVSGAMAAITAGTTGHVLRRSGGSVDFGTIVNAGVDAAAAIDGTKISPVFGAQLVTTTTGLAIGASPATTGAIRLTNGTGITARSTVATNASVLQFTNGDGLVIGDSAFQTIINGSGALSFRSANAVCATLNASVLLLSTPTIAFQSSNTTPPTIKQNDQTVASTNGLSITVTGQNATGATSTGGAGIFGSGTGTTDAGDVSLKRGATTVLTSTSALMTIGASANIDLVLQATAAQGLKIKIAGTDYIQYVGSSQGLVFLTATDSIVVGGAGVSQVMSFTAPASSSQANISFFAVGAYGGGKGVFFIGNKNTAPSSDPSSGYFNWSEGGVPAWRSSAGDRLTWTMTSAAGGVMPAVTEYINIIFNGNARKIPIV